MPNIKVIVNPQAGRGYGRHIVPKIHACLKELHLSYDLVYTQAPGHAIELAQEAHRQGFEIIAGVGGDGTSNEIVNGLMAQANGLPAGTLACIPAGSGNDFAAMNGVPSDVEAACRLIARSQTRYVDVGYLTIDGEKSLFFDNTVGIGFDGLVSKETRRYKHVRGLALYLPVVIKTILVTLQPIHARIDIDDETIEQDAMMLIISNGPREGHTFLVAPNARCDDGLLDVIIVENMSKLGMFGILPRFMAGTHLSDPRVKERKARKVCIASEDLLHVHVDGEIPCDAAHRVEAEILPQRLRIIGG
ncbi:MAG: diacylglycerol kinase family lipid kinase [Anaerolineae bacterium]|nr:diacylglycerol kinase family lipid kinase [Anaerolineae bacterium]